MAVIVDVGRAGRVVAAGAGREPAAERRELERLREVAQRQAVRRELVLERGPSVPAPIRASRLVASTSRTPASAPRSRQTTRRAIAAREPRASTPPTTDVPPPNGTHRPAARVADLEHARDLGGIARARRRDPARRRSRPRSPATRSGNARPRVCASRDRAAPATRTRRARRESRRAAPGPSRLVRRQRRAAPASPSGTSARASCDESRRAPRRRGTCRASPRPTSCARVPSRLDDSGVSCARMSTMPTLEQLLEGQRPRRQGRSEVDNEPRAPAVGLGVRARRHLGLGDRRDRAAVPRSRRASKELAFFRKLLEHNAYMGGMASFAIQPDGWVILHAGRALKGMDANEFATMVAGVGRFADQFDDTADRGVLRRRSPKRRTRRRSSNRSSSYGSGGGSASPFVWPVWLGGGSAGGPTLMSTSTS